MKPSPANANDLSVVSRSTSNAGDAGNRKKLISGATSRIDAIFPLFDEMLKNTKLPSWLYLIQMAFVSLQMLFTSYWLAFRDILDIESAVGSVLKYFFMVTYFTDLNGNSESLIIGFIVLTAVVIIYYATLIIQGLVYKSTRHFIKWALYWSRFMIEIVPTMCDIPLGYFIGESLFLAINTRETLAIVFFVFSIIYFTCFITSHYLMCYLFANSAYISTSPAACWSGSFYFIMIVGNSAFNLVAWWIQFFQPWLRYVIVIIKIACTITLTANTVYLSFIHYHSNTLIATLMTSTFPLDIFCLVQCAGIKIDIMYNVIVMVAFLIIGWVVWHFITENIVAKVKRHLSYEALEDVIETEDCTVPNTLNCDQYLILTDTARRQLFLNYGLDRNVAKCRLYMRIGISNHCPLFTDWSLAKFINEYHNSAEINALVTQFISFFPCESRLLNYFFLITASKPKLNIGARFLLYQVHRVKGLRQSSASSEITEKLLEMKQLANSGINRVRTFWEMIPKDPSLLYEIYTSTRSTKALFMESIEKWPNNCRICEDYSNFLIECATDFCEGLKIRNRANLIEQGKNFTKDISFKSLVQAYPAYLKKNIMDIRGNFLKTSSVMGGKNSSNNSTNSQLSSNTIEGDLDIEVEEQLAKNSFSWPRLRLAYQRSLEFRKSENNKRLKGLSCFSLLLAIALLLFLFVYYFNIFNNRRANMTRQLTLNHFRYGFDAAIATIVTHWAHKQGLISDELLGNATSGLAARSQKTNNYNLQFNSIAHPLPEGFTDLDQGDYSMIDEILKWIRFSRDNIEQLLTQMVDFASDGEDIYNTMSAIVKPIVSIDFCGYNDDPDVLGMVPINHPESVSLKNAITYGLIKMANVTQVEYAQAHDWQLNKGLCECFINIPNMFDSFNNLVLSITMSQTAVREKATKNNYIILGCICIGYNIICMPALLVTLYQIFKELKTLMIMMGNIEKKDRDEAAKTIRIGNNIDMDSLNEGRNRNAISPCLMSFMVVFFCLFGTAVVVATIMIVQDKNDSFLSLNTWMFLGISRGNFMLECIIFSILTVLVTKKPDSVRYIDAKNASRLTFQILGTLSQYNYNLLRGSESSKPCIGVNAKLDALNFDDNCHDETTDTDFHNTYRCASLDRGIALFGVLITEILDAPKNVSLGLDGTFYHAYHLMNSHLMDPSYEAAELLAKLSSDAIDEFQIILIVIFIIGVLVMVVVFVLFMVCLNRLDKAFEGALQLLRRLPPLCVISNQELFNYLMNKKTEKVVEKLTASKSAIRNAKDAVIFLNRGESIEVVNKSITQLFGYTPEQLLGQPVSTLLSQDDNQNIYEQFNYMLNGEAPLLYETNTQCISDDEQTISVHVTVLGIAESGNKAESFVVIFRDISSLEKQQKEAEIAKKTSEDLLYQILPRDIVVRLNHGETDITFVVPSSTIIFIDIVKFSDYASTLTPAQIMENLSLVFASFDNIAAKYELITKIKLIGDVYMAAAGLFDPDTQPSSHAKQIVQFALDALSALEEANTQLNSSLSVRIGVNTGGPLIAGVLGTDKPVFDIIGDPINVASRLQSTGIPNTVQISQKTYEQIATFGFNIEQRGEIHLKGKGKQLAYIVRPSDVSSFMLSIDSHTAPTDQGLQKIVF